MPSKHNVKTVSSADLTETEQDLLLQMQNGFELQTDTLGGDPLLRKPKHKELIRPTSATRNTVKALEKKGLISAVKGADPLRITWRWAGQEKSMRKRK